MLAKNQEIYVFQYLSLIDMQRVQDSLQKMREVNDPFVKEALFRDAVISYAKPFSDNRGEHRKKGLKINQTGIPRELKSFHRQFKDIRNKIFAHNDLEYQGVNFGPGTSFTVKGYSSFYSENLIEPLESLAKVVFMYLLSEIKKLEETGL